MESELLNETNSSVTSKSHLHARVGADAEGDGRVRLHALIVALFGMSVSLCALSSHSLEIELDDEDVAERLRNVSLARRLTKPTIHFIMGNGIFSTLVTAFTSLLLLIAVMSKESWHRHGARWLAAPALLVTALEATSDAADALLAAALLGPARPLRALLQMTAVAVMICVEILVWFFMAKFFEYTPASVETDSEKEA